MHMQASTDQHRLYCPNDEVTGIVILTGAFINICNSDICKCNYNHVQYSWSSKAELDILTAKKRDPCGLAASLHAKKG